MIVETSALVAILLHEPEAEAFATAIRRADRPILPASCYLETGIVVDDPRRGMPVDALDRAIARLRIEIFPVTVAQARTARDAHRRFGRHSGHPARLNFGDCFSYALARDLNRPLLFKGNDFMHTDIMPALA